MTTIEKIITAAILALILTTLFLHEKRMALLEFRIEQVEKIPAQRKPQAMQDFGVIENEEDESKTSQEEV